MNGAQALIRTLVDSEVDVCFANPGTSEMHFVAALDSVPEMRAVLGLFEGVVTGAADGYARMADRPAATLLHLGPGLGNGIANLHNARRANVPMVNIVGDHATYHHQYDAPLDSDIETLARNISGWIRTSRRAADIPGDAADAVAAARRPPGEIATLILPADVSWTEGAEPVAARPRSSRSPVTEDTVAVVAKALRSGEPVTFLLGGAAVRENALRAVSRIAGSSGAKVFGETFPARLERGAGLPPLDRLGYLAEFAVAQLAGTRHLVLVDAKAPASFFAYPEKPSSLVPDDCEVHTLASGSDDVVDALERLADAIGAASTEPVLQPAGRPDRPTGPITGATIADAVGALLPEGAIVADEAQTGGLWAAGATAGAPRHDWLTLTGARSAWACRSRPVPRSPAPIVRSSTSRPTAVPCTRCSRCGRRHAKASTSRRSSSPTAPTRSSTSSSAGSGSKRPAPRPRACWTCTPPTSTSSRSRPAWGSTRYARRTARSSPWRSSERSGSPVRT